jgi:hypothetical protein
MIKKTPKVGTWKWIEYELEKQGALSQDIEDGEAFFVHGKFSTASLQAFDKHHYFHSEHIETVVVFKLSRKLKECLRFGFDKDIKTYELHITKENDHLHFTDYRWRQIDNVGSRYIASTVNYVAPAKISGWRYLESYFYMDRII